jgi:hypothetical protein
MSPARRAAYRRLALTVLGLDVPTLTAKLRARRLASAPWLRLVPPSSRAARLSLHKGLELGHLLLPVVVLTSPSANGLSLQHRPLAVRAVQRHVLHGGLNAGLVEQQDSVDVRRGDAPCA